MRLGLITSTMILFIIGLYSSYIAKKFWFSARLISLSDKPATRNYFGKYVLKYLHVIFTNLMYYSIAWLQQSRRKFSFFTYLKRFFSSMIYSIHRPPVFWNSTICFSPLDRFFHQIFALENERICMSMSYFLEKQIFLNTAFFQVHKMSRPVRYICPWMTIGL